ncbi:MAG: hypothetical protein ACFFCH_06485 [Promethearchaeota archaeon]
MNLGWTYNWSQFVLVGFLSIMATIVNFILGSYGAVIVGIIFTAVFLISGITMLIINKVFNPPLT